MTLLLSWPTWKEYFYLLTNMLPSVELKRTPEYLKRCSVNKLKGKALPGKMETDIQHTGEVNAFLNV